MNSQINGLFARIDRGLIYPPFLLLVEQLITNLTLDSLTFFATSGLRTFQEQDELYAKGRTAPGGKVTNARGGMSAHNYGVAVDFTKDSDPSKPGLQPSWKAAEYKPLADRAVALGLEPGYYWKSIVDAPHIQLPLKSENITFLELSTIHARDGVHGVWEYLDGFSWATI